MTTSELLSQLRSLDVKLWMAGDRLRYNAPNGVMTTTLVAELAQRKHEIIEYLHNSEDAVNSNTPPLAPVPRRAKMPVSFAQQRLWFLDKLLTAGHIYNIPVAVSIKGSLNPMALEQSFKEIIRRHESLRTTFSAIGGEPFQIVHDTGSFSLAAVNLETIPAPVREETARRLALQESRRHFDLIAGPLLRAMILRLTPNDHIVLLTAHHIVSDGWSMGVLLKEVVSLSRSFSNGFQSLLDELPIQYSDYAVWQREWIRDDTLEQQLSYWRKMLGGPLPVLELPTDRPRPALRIFRGAFQSFVVPTGILEALRRLSSRHGTTLFMTLLAGFLPLLYRYTGQTDIPVGTPVAGRNRTELERLIGLFVNTLVLRTDLSGAPGFGELLGRVREVVLGADAHQHLPFERLVEELQPDRDLSNNPLFQVLFSMENIQPEMKEPPVVSSDLKIQRMDLASGTGKFDLVLFLMESPQGLVGSAEYNTEIHDKSTIIRILEHYKTLLESIAADEEQPLTTLSILNEAARQHLLIEWNETATPIPTQECVCEIFERHVSQTPDAIALLAGQTWISYRELNKRANRLARYLQSAGVHAELLVGIFLERSVEAVIGILGVLKAGGAYLPLDPAYPKDRLAFILADSRAGLSLTRAHVSADFDRGESGPVRLDVSATEIERYDDDNLATKIDPDQTAYVIYTSGSTGWPKGVPVRHEGLVNLAQAQIGAFGVRPESRVLQLASLSFDASASEILMALLAGAMLCLEREELLKSEGSLIRLLKEQSITTATLSPSILSILPSENLPALETIIAAGEACSPEIVVKWAQGRNFYDAYGPTETSVCATIGKCRPGDVKTLIGRPIANFQAYLLDRDLHPVPIGVPGELYLGGIGLSRGYLNRPELAAEKFIANHLSLTPGERLYKSGDMGQYFHDGRIEFLGRIDRQVKIRGFRIELGEVESALRRHPDLVDAVVVVREDSAGDNRLVAFAVPRTGAHPIASELRAFIKATLPDYMVPSAFVMLEKLPLSPNGKVEYRRLLAPEQADLSSSAHTAPRDSLEEDLIRIWEEVLGISPIGIDDDFFALGGHSLLALRLTALIEQELGCSLPVATLFQSPTVEEFADALRQQVGTVTWSPLVAIQPKGTKRPFFFVHSMDGGVMIYRNLAQHLGLDQPFYGLQAPPLAEVDQSPSIVEMAIRYTEEIRTVQPEGPYFIGGYSYGGYVAFEMANQLRKREQSVALLAIVDCKAPTLTQESSDLESILVMLAREHARQRGKDLDISSDELRGLDRDRQLDSVLGKLKEANLVSPDIGLPWLRRFLHGFMARLRAAENHVSTYYPGGVTLFKAEMIDPEVSKLQDQSAISSDDPTRGWSAVTGQPVDVHLLPGYHELLYQEPYVQVLAAKIKECIHLAERDQR